MVVAILGSWVEPKHFAIHRASQLLLLKLDGQRVRKLPQCIRSILQLLHFAIAFHDKNGLLMQGPLVAPRSLRFITSQPSQLVMQKLPGNLHQSIATMDRNRSQILQHRRHIHSKPRRQPFDPTAFPNVTVSFAKHLFEFFSHRRIRTELARL